MGAHATSAARVYVVLADLGDRTKEHDGKTILLQPEIDATRAAYEALDPTTIDLTTLPERLHILLRRDGKIGASAIVDDVENMLCYLAKEGIITLPQAKAIGRHRAQL